MATTIECALMAGASYVSTRNGINRFPTPGEWTAVTNPPHFNDDTSGFEAIAFKNGTEIVISYAGTYDESSADMTADIDLAAGVGTMQLYQAALYYLQVKEVNSNATISFTGHSLGGGLAALMAVLFDEPAVTFDQAPFANAARVPVRDCVVSYLNDHGYTNARLASLAPELLSYSGNGQRSGNVTNEYVDGELLHTPPFSACSTIGTQLPPLTHGGDASGGELHSQALLTAFKQSGAFQQMTFDLPSLLGLLFSQDMFAHATDTSDANIIDLFVRHQFGGVAGVPAGGDAMLDRFTTDMDTLVQADRARFGDRNAAGAVDVSLAPGVLPVS